MKFIKIFLVLIFVQITFLYIIVLATLSFVTDGNVEDAVRDAYSTQEVTLMPTKKASSSATISPKVTTPAKKTGTNSGVVAPK